MPVDERRHERSQSHPRARAPRAALPATRRRAHPLRTPRPRPRSLLAHPRSTPLAFVLSQSEDRRGGRRCRRRQHTIRAAANLDLVAVASPQGAARRGTSAPSGPRGRRRPTRVSERTARGTRSNAGHVGDPEVPAGGWHGQGHDAHRSHLLQRDRQRARARSRGRRRRRRRGRRGSSPPRRRAAGGDADLVQAALGPSSLRARGSARRGARGPRVGGRDRLRHPDPFRQRRRAAEGVPRSRRRAVAAGRLVDKVATAFTSAQTEHGGQESTILALNNTLYHWGAIVLPLGYTVQRSSTAAATPTGRRTRATTTARGRTRRRCSSPGHRARGLRAWRA